MSEIVPDLVSTIIPVYNRVEMLRSAVASVLAQTWRPIEIVISDDGSLDETSAVGQQMAKNQPEVIRYVRNTNRGPGPAREAGRLIAQGEYIQYLDSDDRLLPKKFELQVAALRAHKDCGIAYGLTRLIDIDGRELRAPYKWTHEVRNTLFPGLLVDRWWCTHTPLYRRSVADSIGPWSDLRYSQDWEYDARAGALGTRLISCGEYVSEHRHHEGNRQTGGGRWLLPSDRVRFFQVLYQCALRAGISSSASEMKHFARWVFWHARESGSMGEDAAAFDLLAMAKEAAGANARDINAYDRVVKVLGWKFAARMANATRKVLAYGKSTNTLQQSWMKEQ